MELAVSNKQIVDWNYGKSVTKMQPKITAWKGLTIEIVQELAIAQQALSTSGRRIDLENANLVPNGTRLENEEEIEILSPRTWEEYLNDIGIARRTAYNWLERYVPEEQRLLEAEELKQLKLEKKEALYKHHLKLAKQFEKHGAPKPEGWNSKTQKIYEEYMANKGKGATVAREKFGNAMPTINFTSIDPEKLDIAEYQAAKKRNFEFLEGVKTQEENKHIVMFMTLEGYINTLSAEERADRMLALMAKLNHMLEIASQEAE